MKGLYIHIPFCKTKCDYCDFYSFVPKESERDSYLKAVLSYIERVKENINGGFDTVYFGGGTPSFFGGNRLAEILKKCRECFHITDDAEITVECNPSSTDRKLTDILFENGVDRISMGVQSALLSERRLLGRQSDCEQVKKALDCAQKSGIKNISLDLMLGIPGQTPDSLSKSLDFVRSCDVKHISAYILKAEENTPLYKKLTSLPLPDEDSVCDMYLQAVSELEKSGFMQYEISNFAVPGFESRHNLKYWQCEEYLGIGPAAHSFINGKRFYFERSIKAFESGKGPIYDCAGGTPEEYIMLTLRLVSGLSNEAYKKRFGKNLPKELFEKAEKFEKLSLLKIKDNTVSLTPQGFLLSNTIISELCETV